MARIRTIKPEFFTSEDIVSLSPLARLLYIAVWCEADKEGRLAWKPRTFKMRYLPGDDCDISQLCEELTACGLVVLYGDGLAHIPSFTKHQHVNPRESASNLPAPPGGRDSLPRKVGKTMREAILERDGYRCVRCSGEDRLQVDHILPQSCGGPHIAENLRTLCGKCNAGRPVAGKALDDDLAQDGFTVQSLRDKFGIDASIPDPHAQVGREGKGKEGKDSSEANASGGKPPGDEAETPEDPRRELYQAGKSLLHEQGMPKAQTGSFITKLAQDYGQDVALEAVRSAVSNRPIEAAAYLKATCQRLKGERRDPITVPSTDTGAEKFKAAMDERAATATKPPAAVLELARKSVRTA